MEFLRLLGSVKGIIAVVSYSWSSSRTFSINRLPLGKLKDRSQRGILCIIAVEGSSRASGFRRDRIDVQPPSGTKVIRRLETSSATGYTDLFWNPLANP